MTAVLFVDDEPILLRTLRRRLAQHRPGWEAHFASGGAEALTYLAENSVDILVTDVAMPGMDGLTLLGHVREQHPHIGRIVLSGNAVGTDVRGLVLPHQWLSKPCSLPAMCMTIDRVRWAKGLVEDRPDLVRRVLGQTGLPSPPPTFARLLAALERHASVAEIVEIVAGDPAIVAKLLQLANSAFYGNADRIASVERAVAVLGTTRIGMIVLTAELFRPGSVASELAEHSQRVARIAHRLRGPSDAATAGLLHGVGTIAAGEVADVGERELARLGGLLLGTWGLPLEIASAVAHCRDPEGAPDPKDPTLATLALADALAHDESDAIIEARSAALGLAPEAARAHAIDTP
jgi:HD-like signal output (HDOD) protein/ActR/RegA family two-component response regulator